MVFFLLQQNYQYVQQEKEDLEQHVQELNRQIAQHMVRLSLCLFFFIFLTLLKVMGQLMLY